MLTTLGAVLVAFNLIVLVYFVLRSAAQLVMSPLAARFMRQHQRRQTRRARAVIDRLAAPPLVSVVVPAFNEALTIVANVRALLALEYEARELVVVNDGSSDATLDTLRAAFQLVPAPLAYVQSLAAAPVRGIYRSIADPGLVVVDKARGGCKADALNAGINAASGTLVLAIDADTVLEPDALTRAVLPFLEDPQTVALGGNIAIVNGCRVDDGRIVDVGLPRSWLARFQVIEYMRAFLLFRLACASVNGVVLISGAFGLFKRDALIDVGGFDRRAIGEDMDLTVRLQRHFRARRQPIRIAFDPNPLGWTQAPEDWLSLRSQRWRWRRGLVQVLWRHRGMIGHPRFGVVGLAILPHVLLIDGIGPLLEITGYALTGAAAAGGLVDWRHFRVLVVASVFFGMGVSLLAVLLSDIATGNYMRPRDLGTLVAAATLESCGYRQINAWWSCVGTIHAMSGRRGAWGVIKRRTLET